MRQSDGFERRPILAQHPKVLQAALLLCGNQSARLDRYGSAR